jgi:hypothetical protein
MDLCTSNIPADVRDITESSYSQELCRSIIIIFRKNRQVDPKTWLQE